MKGGVGHDVPLGESALELLKTIPGAAGDFVFTFTGDTPLRHYAGAKQKLDAALLAIAEIGERRTAGALDVPRPAQDGALRDGPPRYAGARHRGRARTPGR